MKKYFTILLFHLPLFLTAQIYVDQNVSGNDNGTSWADAFQDLQDAINAANPGDEIWVAEGIYYPTFTRSNVIGGQSSSPQGNKSTFFIHKDIKIYGGFAGDETEQSQRDWANNPTTLSGNHDEDSGNWFNSNHVVYLEEVSSACLIDGFTIADGNANKNDHYNTKGAGIFNISNGTSSNPTINNCTFQNNESYYGAAMYNLANGGTCSPSLNNCQFISNIASVNGGAIYNEANGGDISLMLTDCTFSNNMAEEGAAIFNFSQSGTCSPILDNCAFNFNEASKSGAGLYNHAKSSGNTSPVLSHCTFTQNVANYGGGIFNRSDPGDCNPKLTFCSFQTNEAIYHGGAVYNQTVGGASVAEYINCFFKQNIAYLGAGMYTINSAGSSDPILTNCTFISNSATDLGGAMYTKAVFSTCSPQITNCTFSQNSTNNGGDGMYNTQSFGTCSPIISNSILWDAEPILNDNSASPSINFSIVRGATLAAGTTNGGNNLINFDPLFVDEANEDLRLRPCSPAVDNANVLASQYPEDLDGNNRVINLLDIGAFETQVKRVLLDEPSNTYTADAEYTDSYGWTHYFDCENNVLLLSLNKNGQDIGSINDGTFDVEITTNGAYNSGKGVDLSAASYVETGDFSAMNRYWNVYPTTQPTEAVNVRFYYSPDDLQDLKGSNSRIKDITKSFFFKVDNSNNPHELNIPFSDFHEYTYNATTPSTTQWTDGNYQGFNYAEYQVNSFSGGGGGTGAKMSSLPVELVYFEASADEDQIVLEWHTASESNSRGFNVEHSQDGSGWDVLGFVPAHGNTTEKQKYTYVHREILPGTQYYRLNTLDYDDSFEYSKIESVDYQNEHFSADVFPNPMSEKGTINYYQTGESLETIRVFNMAGQEIHLFDEIQDGVNQLELDVPLVAGMYMVSFETATKKTVKRLVVQKM